MLNAAQQCYKGYSIKNEMPKLKCQNMLECWNARMPGMPQECKRCKQQKRFRIF